MNNQRLRGAEATLRVAVDGILARGSMIKVKDFEFTPRMEITEHETCGEQETELDVMHHGWGGSFSVDMTDGEALALCDRIVEAEANKEVHPTITITVTYRFREGAQAGGGRVVLYHDNLVLIQGAEGAGSRKDNVAVKFEFKCKKRKTITA